MIATNLSQYNTRNRRLFEKGLTMYIDTVAENEIDLVFNRVIDRVYTWLDGYEREWKSRTFNLYDSIGFGKYKQGVLWRFYQDKSRLATEDKLLWVAKGTIETINGFDLLQAAIGSKEGADTAEYALVLFAAVPYAEWVELSLGKGGSNKRGKGWWSNGIVPYTRKVFQEEAHKNIGSI